MLAVIQVQIAARQEAEIVEAPSGSNGHGNTGPGDADAAARDVLPGERDLGDDGGEAQRRHGEVEGAQPERRQADDDTEHRAHPRASPSAR